MYTGGGTEVCIQASHGCPAVFRGSQQVPQRRTDALFSRLSRPGEHLARVIYKVKRNTVALGTATKLIVIYKVIFYKVKGNIQSKE